MGKTIAEQLFDQGFAEGLKIGLAEGDVRTPRRLLLRWLRQRFGKILAAMVQRIKATERIDLLDAWFDQVSAAKTLKELSFTDG